MKGCRIARIQSCAGRGEPRSRVDAERRIMASKNPVTITILTIDGASFYSMNAESKVGFWA